jgi:tRNA-binding protein
VEYEIGKIIRVLHFLKTRQTSLSSEASDKLPLAAQVWHMPLIMEVARIIEHYDFTHPMNFPTAWPVGKMHLMRKHWSSRTFVIMEDTSPLSWQEFTRVQMHVGTVLSADPFPEAHNPSYKLKINFGPLGQRKTSAQITDRYQAEELVGRQVIAVLNFPPKQIANMMSECLVLGGMEGGIVTLLRPDTTVADGTRIG